MVRFAFIAGILVLVAMVYSIVDIALIDRFRVRGAPKAVWVLIVVLLPAVGVVLWFTLGRARKRTTQAPIVAPDDDPDFLARMNRGDADRIRRLEQELADLDDDPPTGKD